MKDASIHPVVSSVLYLDDGGNSGAPTVLIDQRLSGGSSDRAWLCVPKTSRLLLFDGALLHGVAPHISNEPISSGARLTLMIGWWSPQVITMPHGLVLGPNMTMPQATATTLASWPALFRPLPTAIVTSLNDVRKNGLTKSALINIEKNVWEKVKTQERNPKETNDLQSVESNDILFVGNWFLKSRNDINDEIMQSLNITDSPKVESVMVSADVGWLSFEDLKKMRGDT